MDIQDETDPEYQLHDETCTVLSWTCGKLSSCVGAVCGRRLTTKQCGYQTEE
jgi:hypothetical protein